MKRIQLKILIALLGISIIPLLIVGVFSLTNSTKALSAIAFGQLESIREIKKTQLENFFTELDKNVDGLIQTVASLEDAAFDKVSSAQENKKAQILDYFNRNLSDITVLSRNATVLRALADFKTTFSLDGTYDTDLFNFFEEIKYGNSLKQFKNQYGYYDLLLIDRNGDVVYSTNRELDLGQNVLTGPLRDTNLGKCFLDGQTKANIKDFERYPPADYNYLAFLGAPVKATNNRLVGVLVLKLDPKAINKIVNRRRGMGRTGETYIIGLSNNIAYYRSDRPVEGGNFGQKASNIPIERLLTSPSGPYLVEAGSTGKMAIAIYDRLQIPGLDWLICTEMELEEAIAPTTNNEQEDYFAGYIQSYGFTNLFLITPSGDVFYAVKHGPEYQTNLLKGRFANSGLGSLFRKVMATRISEFVDYSPYAPAGGNLYAFVGQPVIHENRVELVVALQLPHETINNIMRVRSGMGKTGETYLVGPDKALRSDTYKGTEAFTVQASFAEPRLRIDTLASREALAGKTGEQIGLDYQGKQVLSAYTPLRVWDTNWALIAEINTKEAFETVEHFKILALTLGFVTLSVIILVSFLMARHFARPLARLTEAAEQVRIKNFDISVEVQSNDEFELLADAFNSMVTEIRDYSSDLEQKIDLLKKADADLRNSWEQIKYLADAAWEAIIIHEDGILIQANQQFYELFGYEPEELSGRPLVPILIPPDSMEFVNSQMRSGNLGPYEAIGLKKTGEKFPMEVRIKQIEFQGRPVRVVAVRDISERIRAEVERVKLETQLRQAHKMEAIGTLAGGIAHDFNNILSGIIGFTELSVLDVPRDSLIRQNLQQVLKAAARAKGLIQQILTFSRRTEQERLPMEIAPIVKESVDLIRSSIPSTIEIKADLNTKPALILADSTQISQVVMNLCTNAADSMRDTGGLLEIKLTEIEFDEDAIAQFPGLRPGKHQELTISDSGGGIDQEIISRIFDPFFTTKDHGKGTGMGLAVVHGIVKVHDGAIHVYSAPGRGATFKVYFPVVDTVLKTEVEPGEKPPTGTESILFIDDEEMLVSIGLAMLQKLGYQVVGKTDPAEALEEFKARPNNYDLVITDLTMPKMTGDRLARAILGIRPDMPIILCTGYSEKIDEKEAKDLGIREFILKPVTLGLLARTIRKVLDAPQL